MLEAADGPFEQFKELAQLSCQEEKPGVDKGRAPRLQGLQRSQNPTSRLRAADIACSGFGVDGLRLASSRGRRCWFRWPAGPRQREEGRTISGGNTGARDGLATCGPRWVKRGGFLSNVESRLGQARLGLRVV